MIAAFVVPDNAKRLKPCPFCGGEAKLDVHVFGKLGNTFGIRCTECQAQTRGFYDTADEATEAWNRRADDWLERSLEEIRP